MILLLIAAVIIIALVVALYRQPKQEAEHIRVLEESVTAHELTEHELSSQNRLLRSDNKRLLEINTDLEERLTNWRDEAVEHKKHLIARGILKG